MAKVIEALNWPFGLPSLASLLDGLAAQGQRPSCWYWTG